MGPAPEARRAARACASCSRARAKAPIACSRAWQPRTAAPWCRTIARCCARRPALARSPSPRGSFWLASRRWRQAWRETSRRRKRTRMTNRSRAPHPGRAIPGGWGKRLAPPLEPLAAWAAIRADRGRLLDPANQVFAALQIPVSHRGIEIERGFFDALEQLEVEGAIVDRLTEPHP